MNSDARISARWPIVLELLLVVCLFGVPLFVKLGQPDLDNDEAIYSYAVDRMIETGEWATPRSIPDDLPFLEKPPLKFWLVASAIKAGLLPHREFGLRFFDALFGAVAFVYVFLFGRLLAGPGCGFIACLILFTFDALVFSHGLRSNTMDAPLFLAYCGSLYHFARWVEGRSGSHGRAHALAVGAYFALGFMTKFVAVLFAPPVGALALAWRRDALYLIRSRWREWVAAGLLVLAIVAPWFIYQTAIRGPAMWKMMFGVHVYDRFTVGVDAGHFQPWHFYFSGTWNELGRAGAHWISAAGLVMLTAQAWTGRSWVGRLLWVWWIVPFALLSIAPSKLFHYIYPFLPPLALGAGWAGVAVFRRLDHAHVRVGKAVRRTVAIAIIGLVLPVSAYVLQANDLTRPRSPLRVLRDCAVSAPPPRETRVYVSYWDRLKDHAIYYYLRGIGPWNATAQVDADDLQRRLSDPSHFSPVVIAHEDYVKFVDPKVDVAGLSFPSVAILTPGQFAICGEAAVAAGGTAVAR